MTEDTTYYVQTNLNHDGKEFKTGDTIELSDVAAAPLLAAGVISTDEVEREEASVTAPQVEESPAEPTVGGTPAESGEPSIDTKVDTQEADTATDVTPGATTEEKDISADL